MDGIDLNKVWEINPYNGTAFGALIVLLLAVIYYLYKTIQEQKEDLKQKSDEQKLIIDRFHEKSDIIKEKLIEVKFALDGLNNTSEDVKNKIEYLIREAGK